MSKKKIAIVGLFYHPEMPSRVKMLKDYFSTSYNPIILTADFVHPYKTYDYEEWDKCLKLHVPRYRTNFSISRIWSHIVYAWDIKKALSREQLGLVYVCVPPNYSALKAVTWAKRHNIPVIVDVVDLWPNINAPSNNLLKLAYKVWGSIRDKAVLRADKVLIECSLYKDDIPVSDSMMIPLCKKNDEIPHYAAHDGIRIAYLGAFSTSYDFDSLIYLAQRIKERGRRLTIVLIGKGNEKDKVVANLKENKIEFEDYGVVYDEFEKKKILESCDFGYNGFTPGMAVGQSYKSIDYMGCGLALINSLKGDLEEIVLTEKCGYNFDKTSRSEIAGTIARLSKDEIAVMKDNSFNAFEKYFSWRVYIENMDKVMKELNV